MLDRIKTKLRDRRGIAIEMALLVMVITFSFSLMITATSILHHDKMVKADKEFARTVVAEQITYDFCAAAESGDHSWVSKYPDYDVSVVGLNLTVKEKDSETVLLLVTLTDDAGTYRISTWEKQ